MANKKEKKYLIDNPVLIAEWNWEKNDDLKLENFTVGSGKKVWWKCNKGHEWEAAIINRHQGTGCPYCYGRFAISGVNDLQTLNPTLAKEWNYEKNGELYPENIASNSGKKVWWKCEKGHEWQAQILNRNHGTGCPICAGKKVLFGYNDLQTLNPTLAKEWNYEKNQPLTPLDITSNSEKKVWWICRNGHEWQASIAHRNYGQNCPICNIEKHSSFPEYAILYYLKKSGLEAIHSYKENGYELDIFIPSLKTAIEYDGYFWHKDKMTKDLEKNFKCQKDGIKLYRIREGLPTLNDYSIDYKVQKNQKDLPIIIGKIINEITDTTVDIDIKRDFIDIENLRVYIEKSNSIFYINPTLAKEWNYNKNGKLKPENFTAASNKKVWWKCNKGHEWEAAIAHRNKGANCPYCSGRYAILGETDLKTLNPQLASEWNYEKNGNLKPENFTSNSGTKVWWICKKKHEWKASISDRNNGTNCPYCSGRFAIKGKNDLLTLNPILSREWNFERNKNLTPENYKVGSGKKVWWICNNGHEWQAIIRDRVNGNKCPYCIGKKIIVGFNDLSTTNPTLSSEWNYEKNASLMPENFTAGSGKKVWWKCKKGHEYIAQILSRNHGTGCPICASKKVLPGYNDLQTINPTLAKEWNYEKNQPLTPLNITSNSEKKVWWICINGHEWMTTVSHRNNGQGCPICYRNNRKRKS